MEECTVRKFYNNVMPESLRGVIERVTFHNLDSGYCVLRVRAAGQAEPVVVVGNLPFAVAGETVVADGDWVIDRQHGPQFRAATLATTDPRTPEGMAKFLGSGLVKGIGPTYAKKIVAQFGLKTFEILDLSPGFLKQVKGLGPKRIAAIREGWKETRGVREVMAFLLEHGVGTARAHKIYRHYGDTAIEIIKSNPYKLAEDIWGVGFRSADELALKLGRPADSPERAAAAVKHALREATTGGGHAGLPEELLIEQAIALAQLPMDAARNAVVELMTKDEYRHDSGLIYPAKLFEAEVALAAALLTLSAGRHPLAQADVEAALRVAEGSAGFALAEAQAAAVRLAISKKVLVVTGGPGTGKTTVVRSILAAFGPFGGRVALAAPTGRAAKRLAEATGREAKTVHRLLEYDPAAGGFRRNENDPLEAELIVVDEASMLDLPLAASLLRSIPAHACLVLVGDVDQLPSVGPGRVLADLIDSKTVAVARLTEIHRQASKSYIVAAAHAVNQGREPESAPRAQGDFFQIDIDDPPAVIERMLQAITDRIPKAFGLDALADVQVLAPMNRGELGVKNLNAVLQARLNPPGPGTTDVARYGIIYRTGDKVIQMRNNYKREVFNGDLGRIAAIDAVEQVATVVFDGRKIDYEYADLDELALAYAVTVHKSQGSEYPAVVLPLHTQHYVMLQRNLLYTAITRGRKLVVLIGPKRAAWLAASRADDRTRFGRLIERLTQRNHTS
jgi:exodeoxyribonuclease V alpha subunit